MGSEMCIRDSPNKISISPLTLSRSTRPPPRIRAPIIRRRIVRWAGLQPNGRIRVKMTNDALQGRRNAALLLVERGSALAACASGGLGVEVALGRLWGVARVKGRRWGLHHAHGCVVGLVRVGGRDGLDGAAVDLLAAVHARGLDHGWLLVLPHLHGCVG